MGWLAAFVGGPLGFLAAPLLKAAKWALVVLLVVLALLGMERYIRNRGRLEAKLDGLEGAIKTVETRKRIEQRVREMPENEVEEWLIAPSQRRKR